MQIEETNITPEPPSPRVLEVLVLVVLCLSQPAILPAVTTMTEIVESVQTNQDPFLIVGDIVMAQSELLDRLAIQLGFGPDPDAVVTCHDMF